MGSFTALTAALLQAGVLMGVVLLAQELAVRRLPVESIPGELRGRVTMATRARPWLICASVMITLAGLALHLSR